MSNEELIATETTLPGPNPLEGVNIYPVPTNLPCAPITDDQANRGLQNIELQEKTNPAESLRFALARTVLEAAKTAGDTLRTDITTARNGLFQLVQSNRKKAQDETTKLERVKGEKSTLQESLTNAVRELGEAAKNAGLTVPTKFIGDNEGLRAYLFNSSGLTDPFLRAIREETADAANANPATTSSDPESPSKVTTDPQAPVEDPNKIVIDLDESRKRSLKDRVLGSPVKDEPYEDEPSSKKKGLLSVRDVVMFAIFAIAFTYAFQNTQDYSQMSLGGKIGMLLGIWGFGTMIYTGVGTVTKFNGRAWGKLIYGQRNVADTSSKLGQIGIAIIVSIIVCIMAIGDALFVQHGFMADRILLSEQHVSRGLPPIPIDYWQYLAYALMTTTPVFIIEWVSGLMTESSLAEEKLLEAEAILMSKAAAEQETEARRVAEAQRQKVTDQAAARQKAADDKLAAAQAKREADTTTLVRQLRTPLAAQVFAKNTVAGEIKEQIATKTAEIATLEQVISSLNGIPPLDQQGQVRLMVGHRNAALLHDYYQRVMQDSTLDGSGVKAPTLQTVDEVLREEPPSPVIEIDETDLDIPAFLREQVSRTKTPPTN